MSIRCLLDVNVAWGQHVQRGLAGVVPRVQPGMRPAQDGSVLFNFPFPSLRALHGVVPPSYSLACDLLMTAVCRSSFRLLLCVPVSPYWFPLYSPLFPLAPFCSPFFILFPLTRHYSSPYSFLFPLLLSIPPNSLYSLFYKVNPNP